MPSETVFISIGSNIEPAVYIPKAIEALRNHPDISDLCVSSFYISDALGRPNQPKYRNGVARFTTSVEPDALKNGLLRRIEHDCGRVRTEDRCAPRTLDLDILLYGDRIIRLDSTTIPDPAIWEHVFVTIPLLEIAPTLTVPGRSGTLIDQLPATIVSELPRDDSLNLVLQEGSHHG